MAFLVFCGLHVPLNMFKKLSSFVGLLLILSYCITVLSNVVFIVIAGIKVFQLSKTSNETENTRFDAERDR